MKKTWYLMKLESKEIVVFVQNNHKQTFKKIISLEQNEKIISFSKIKTKSTFDEFTDVVAKIHINKNKERNRPYGSKDSIQTFIDRFKDVEHVKVHFGLYSYQTHELGLNGKGDLLATNKHPIQTNDSLSKF
ncbi:TPA: hypothetical protein ACS26F_001134 [Serratia marcescens]|nr:hypothetical protein [Serratia marcescens]HAU4297442.1 hypothetical protein [Serratia marcescens]